MGALIDSTGRHDDIQEGVPLGFAVSSPTSSSKYARSGSPTRSMSSMWTPFIYHTPSG